LGNYAPLPAPPPSGGGGSFSNSAYGASYNWSPSSFTNFNNLSTGCMAASGNPQDCNGTMRLEIRQVMGDEFMSNLPGAHDDLYMGENSYVSRLNYTRYGHDSTGTSGVVWVRPLDTNHAIARAFFAHVLDDSLITDPADPQETVDPQNPVSSRVDDALDLLNRNPKCEEALNEVLRRLAEKTGVTRFNNIRDVLEQFRKDGSITDVPDGNSSVTDLKKDSTSIRLSISPNKDVTANRLLHELLHYAGGPNLKMSMQGNQYWANYGDPDIYEAWKDMGVIKSYEDWIKEPDVARYYSEHPELPEYTRDRMSGSAQMFLCLGIRTSPIK
jgi:hypothetical protein